MAAEAVGAGPRSLRFWITLAISLLVTVTVATAIAATIERDTVNAAGNKVRNHLRPAFGAESTLMTSYVDQETGQRGYLLTGEPSFLQPYTQGRTTAAFLQNQLAAQFSADPQSAALLHDVVTNGDAWLNEVAEPQITQREKGPIPADVVTAGTLRGKTLFDNVRSSLSALTNRTESQIAGQLHRVTAAQSDSRTVIDAALVVALVIAALTLLMLQRLLNRPLRRFLGQIQAVAGGEYDASIDTRGPREVAIVATAVGQLRDSLVASSAAASAADHRLGQHRERDRMAAELHDRTIQQVFALGLKLDSVAGRHPSASRDILPLVDETDRVIGELRNVIYAPDDDAPAGPPATAVPTMPRATGSTSGESDGDSLHPAPASR